MGSKDNKMKTSVEKTLISEQQEEKRQKSRSNDTQKIDFKADKSWRTTIKSDSDTKTNKRQCAINGGKKYKMNP